MSRPTPQTIKGPEFSDGDSNHRPDSDFTFPVNPESVLRTIAFKWQKKHLNDGQPGKFSWEMAIGALLTTVMHSLIHLNATLEDYSLPCCARPCLTVCPNDLYLIFCHLHMAIVGVGSIKAGCCSVIFLRLELHLQMI